MNREQLYKQLQKMEKALTKYIDKLAEKEQQLLRAKQEIERLKEFNRERTEWARTKSF